RILALIAGGVLAGIALLLGLAVALVNLLQYSMGLEGTDQLRTTELLGVPVAIAGALGLLYLWPPVQRLVARVIPLRPGSPVGFLTVVLGLLLVAQLIGAQVQPGKPLTIGDLLAQDIPLLILSFVGVGYLVRRSPRETMERLGLLLPQRKRWWLIALLGIGVFMAIAFGIE